MAGPQSRFIIFLIFVLIGYTLLLQVFQKLAAILQLPLFFSISLLTLLVFIGVVGTVYSHSFVGPMTRIRKAIDLLASGDLSVSLRLRDADDRMLKELAEAIGRLSQHARNAHSLINSAAQDLSADIAALQESVRTGADQAELRKHLDGIRTRHEALQKAILTLGRS